MLHHWTTRGSSQRELSKMERPSWYSCSGSFRESPLPTGHVSLAQPAQPLNTALGPPPARSQPLLRETQPMLWPSLDCRPFPNSLCAVPVCTRPHTTPPPWPTARLHTLSLLPGPHRPSSVTCSSAAVPSAPQPSTP